MRRRAVRRYQGSHRARDGAKSVESIVTRTWEYESLTPAALGRVPSWPRIHDSPDAITQIIPRIS